MEATPAQANTQIPNRFTSVKQIPPSLGEHLSFLSSELLRAYNDPKFSKEGLDEEKWITEVRGCGAKTDAGDRPSLLTLGRRFPFEMQFAVTHFGRGGLAQKVKAPAKSRTRSYSDAWSTSVREVISSHATNGKIRVDKVAVALRSRPAPAISTMVIERFLADFTIAHAVDAEGRVSASELANAVLEQLWASCAGSGATTTGRSSANSTNTGSTAAT